MKKKDLYSEKHSKKRKNWKHSPKSMRCLLQKNHRKEVRGEVPGCVKEGFLHRSKRGEKRREWQKPR